MNKVKFSVSVLLLPFMALAQGNTENFALHINIKAVDEKTTVFYFGRQKDKCL